MPEDAFNTIINYLKTLQGRQQLSYGYEVYIPSIVRWYYSQRGIHSPESERYLRDTSGSYFEAAWELCRMGVLRPGVIQFQSQGTDDGRDGAGFCLTEYGKRWISESTSTDFVPIEPTRFGALIEPFGELFGRGYLQRAQQAIRCYTSQAYLAGCAMCGAAAESILLHLATEKSGDAEAVLTKYRSAGGRGKIVNDLMQGQSARLRAETDGFLELLHYWRDESAHGGTSEISENEAYVALLTILKFSQFAKDNYDVLTA